MSDTPMPITGFAIDAAMLEDGRTVVAILTLLSDDQTFEFAINEEGATAMVDDLKEFLDIARSRGGRAN